MRSAYVCPRSIQGQGHNLRLNIVWLYFVSALYLFNPVGIYKLVCTNVSYDETMCSAYVRQRLVQGQGKKITLFPMLHMGYSSPSVIALVYDFTFLYKKNNWFHPVTYGGDMIAFVSESTRLVKNWFQRDIIVLVFVLKYKLKLWFCSPYQ